MKNKKWSDDRVNEYQIQGSRVYGNGQSYNCTNIVTARQLQSTLNNLVEYQNTSIQIEQKLDDITKQIIQLKLSINILGNEVEHLKEVLER